MDALKLLLNASSQKSVEEIFVLAYKRRNDNNFTDKEKKALAELLSITVEEATKLLLASRVLVSEALFNAMEAEDVIQYLPRDLNDKLKQLIAKIITHHMPKWKEQAVGSQISLPRFQDIDWRVDITSASDQMHRMNLPSVIVQLKVKDNPQSLGEEPAMRNVNFEMTKEALDTVLEGLWQIRDQLGSLTK
jgi:hypothetical protein